MTATVNEIRECEVCGGTRLEPVLDLGPHPMCDDLVKVGDARVCREYAIEILYCGTCRTAHQRFQVPKQELFPQTYHYRARLTQDVLTGMANLVQSCETRFGSLEGKRVLDIGCNDGSLLSAFRARGARTFGIEPTGAWADAREQGHTVWHGFLTPDLASTVAAEAGALDFITFTNVFAHIENLPEVLESLRRLMGPSTVIVIENHYLGSVLDTNQFDTFYHEHPRTYSYTSFVHIAKALGMGIAGVEFPSRYGGNIRVFLGRGAEAAAGADNRIAREADFPAGFAKMRQGIETWRERRGAIIRDTAAAHGPLRAKAFPGRAAILFKLLGLDESVIAAVHEKPASMKIGHYVPGTRVPIVSDDELAAVSDKSQPILNLAWHIPQEIRTYLRELGWQGPVIDVVEPADFDGSV